MEKMLRPKDIEEHLNMNKTQVYKLIKLKGFPVININNRFYIPEDKYNKWIDNHVGYKVLT